MRAACPGSTLRWSGLMAAFVCIVSSGCGPGIVMPGVSPDLKHSWEVAFNRRDAAAVAALYSDDAQLVMSGSPPVRGKAAIRAVIADMIKSGVKVRIGMDRNLGSGDIAYVYGAYSVLDPSGDHAVEKGRYVEVWSRHAGTWRIDLDVNAAVP